MTPSERFDALEARINALPPGARAFVQRWRGCVQLMARSAASLDLVEVFIADVERLVSAPPEKVAGPNATGSGY